MGHIEADKSTKDKETKAATTTMVYPEQTSTTTTTPVNPEWPGFQAYSPILPHSFLPSSPHAPPYMWGVQHVMPPYGTPPHPYVAMYPPGGIYAHPTIPPGSYPFSPFAMPSPNAIVDGTPSTADGDGKPSNAKEKLPIKRSKGSLGRLNMITGKADDVGRTLGTSANEACSKSAESGSEGTSEGSDENSHHESQLRSAGASQNGNSVHGPRDGGSRAPLAVVDPSLPLVPISAAPPSGGVPVPTTNLNIGMDYWAAPASSAVPALHGKDERELKRQRRKQSNRESARRSRLRKQAECDELAHCAEALKEENASLRAEVSCIRSKYEKLLEENTSLKERLGEVPEHVSLSSGANDENLSSNTQQTAN